MKRLFVSLAILASISLTTTVDAQQGRKSGKRGAGFTKELNLSAEQQQQSESINKDFATKVDELKAKSDLSNEDKKSKAKELREQRRTAMNNILTPEQQTKAKEMWERKSDVKKSPKDMTLRNKGKGGKQTASKNGRADRHKNLDLTDDQKTMLNALNEDYKNKSKALTEQHKEDLNKIYTPEQQAKLKEFRKNFNKRDGRGRQI